MSTSEQREFARVFGSRARMDFVEGSVCVVPVCAAGGCQNTHIGMGAGGSLADATCILPLCVAHRGLLLILGTEKFGDLYGINLAAEAIDLELRWQQHLSKETGA